MTSISGLLRAHGREWLGISAIWNRPRADAALMPQEQQLVATFRALTPDERSAVLELMKGMTR
jgi:hypothetical protein